MPLKDLRASSLAVKSSLRSAQASLDMLDQQILVELQRDQQQEKLFQSALLLIRDQQAYIASLMPRLAFDRTFDTSHILQALDARASTFTFVENFPHAKKEETAQNDK